MYANRLGMNGALGPHNRHGIHPDETTLGELSEDGPLAVERELLGRALKDIQGLYGAFMGKAGE